MTGRGPQGGPPRRDLWRGGRDEAPPTRETSRVEPVRPWVEVEDLPTQPLMPRARARVPLTGAIAGAAVVVLLAGGFGLLGGRSAVTPESPPPSLVAGLPSPEPPVSAPPPVPQVTPWASCRSSVDQPPEAVLEVDGVQHFGQVELLDVEPGSSFGPVVIDDEPVDAVEVPMDASADIWIVGGACAVAWDIDLFRATFPTGDTLESVANEDRDPAVAAQNRFQLFVAPHVGDYQLRATIVFEQLTVRWTWTIHVPRLQPPAVTLTTADGEIPTVIGCDVTERLANDVVVRLHECDQDVRREPARQAEVAADDVLEFVIEDWAASNRSVFCGQLLDRTFLPFGQPSCVRHQDSVFAGIRFQPPEEAGPLTLAMSTCARHFRSMGNGFDELCGTWYANVLVRD